jgi:hypothetical protein
MLLRKRNTAETLPCCICGAHIGEEDGVVYHLNFPSRTHMGGGRFWSHRECIEGAMHPIAAPDLDRDEAYGTKPEDLEVVLQRASWPCCLCGAEIDERGDRVGLRPWTAQMGYVFFWTHRRCMRKAMSWRSWLRLHMSTKKVKRIAYEGARRSEGAGVDH